MPALEALALSKSYGGRRACWDLTFSVEAGEVYGLLGPNGAGKTTTLRMVAGLFPPDGGELVVAGLRVNRGAPASSALRARVGLLTEAPGFYDRLGTLENLVFFGRLYGLTAAACEVRARKLLSRFLLADKADRPFAELSRGMKQKLAIARALLHEPQVILLDEPTVGLDPEATREVRAAIQELASEGRTVLLCTHALDEVERLCSRAAFIAGRLVGVHDLRALRGEEPKICVRLAAPLGPWTPPPGVRELSREGLSLWLSLPPGRDAAEAVKSLVAAGARIQAVVPSADPLEDAYVALLSRARAEGLLA